MYYKSIYKKEEEDFDDELRELKESQQKTLNKIDSEFTEKKNEYSQRFDSSFKRRIKKRDDYKCQFPDCLIKNDLTVHHVDYQKKHTTDNNCITLCRNHNSFVNKIEEREIWKEYFTKLIHYKLSRGVKND